MLQKKSLQRRRENVQRQLPLWPEEERPNIWEGLDPEAQEIIIAILARLIGKAVRPGSREDENER
jgi:hypothetical protein